MWASHGLDRFCVRPYSVIGPELQVTVNHLHVLYINRQYIFFSDSVRGVECPTCFNRYPVDEILDHADICAPHIFDFGSSNISGQDDSQLEQIATDCWNDDDIDQPTFQSLIYKAKENMETDQPIRVNVRRKTMWDDFTHERARRFKPEQMLKVVFVGEPAIDDGGPRREFLSGISIYEFPKKNWNLCFCSM